jgi:hypothetical protein
VAVGKVETAEQQALETFLSLAAEAVLVQTM